jgi:hypothetical protein
MNSQTLITFMDRLIKGADKKIFLMVDNLKVHHSYIVRDWLKEHEGEIKCLRIEADPCQRQVDGQCQGLRCHRRRHADSDSFVHCPIDGR